MTYVNKSDLEVMVLILRGEDYTSKIQIKCEKECRSRLKNFSLLGKDMRKEKVLIKYENKLLLLFRQVQYI